MAPTTQLVGKWVARDESDHIVASGDTYEELLVEIVESGNDPEVLEIEKVAETGGFVL